MDISILKQCMFMAQNDKVEKTLRNKRIYVLRKKYQYDDSNPHRTDVSGN
jgi:hypothetical protein